MNLDLIKLAGMVSEQGTFAAVAKGLNIDPSSVSRSVAQLEKELGFRLFNRSTRAVSLTESGHRFLTQCQGLLEGFESAKETALELNQQAIGELIITASEAFGQICLIPLLKEFQNRHPKISLKLVFTNNNLDLVAENVDLAVRLSPRFDSELNGTKLFDTSYGIYCSPDYLRSHPKITMPDDLNSHECPRLNLPGFSTWNFLNDVGHQSKIKVNGNLIISSPLALKSCILAGHGPGLLADWMVRSELQDKQLIRLLPGYKVTATDFETAAWLLYPSRHFLPNKVRVMIDFLKEKWT